MSMVSSHSRSDDLLSNKTLILPEDMRDELRVPLGRIVGEDELEECLGSCRRIISIGDMVSHTLVKREIIPQTMIFDGKTERKEMPLLVECLEQECEFEVVKNPPGRITGELTEVVRKAVEAEEPVRIRVEGEEDLAALVVLALAPKGTCVLYGLPGRGIVLVEVDEGIIDKAQSLISRMEESE